MINIAKIKKMLSAVAVASLALPATDARADDTKPNLAKNGDFALAQDTGVPLNWANNTKGRGYIKTHTDANPKFVEIGIANGPEDSFIQQNIKLDRQNETDQRMMQVTLGVTYRYDNIVKGTKGYQTGKIQARFTKGGKDFGAWFDMANLTGSNMVWSTATRELNIPAEAEGVLIRLGFYGCMSGKLEVSSVTAFPTTEADMAAERLKFRPAEPYGEPVSDERFARITHGININGWFCQAWNQKMNGQKGGFTKEFMQGFITEEDIQAIADMGYDHIRLPVDPLILCNREDGSLLTEFLPELDAAIKLIRSKGLAVIVDIHPKSTPYKALATKPTLVKNFVIWWGNFAKHMAETTDPEWVFLELLNEPGGQKYWASPKWQDYQDQLVTIVRANAPQHTIVCNGGAYQLSRELGKVKPHPDRNIIWAVHFYEPSQFTHQGAAWMKDWYHALNEVPWPFTEADVEPTIAKLKNTKAKALSEKVLRNLPKEGIATAEYMDSEFAKIAKWGKDNMIRIHIGEYGVLDRAPRASRLAYLKAINAAMDKHGIARSMWNYGAGSEYSAHVGGKDADQPGKRKPDWELAKALGYIDEAK